MRVDQYKLLQIFVPKTSQETIPGAFYCSFNSLGQNCIESVISEMCLNALLNFNFKNYIRFNS